MKSERIKFPDKVWVYRANKAICFHSHLGMIILSLIKLTKSMFVNYEAYISIYVINSWNISSCKILLTFNVSECYFIDMTGLLMSMIKVIMSQF